MLTISDGGSELKFLCSLLHQAATYAQAQIEALPADLSVAYEMNAIARIIVPATAIAEHMVSLAAHDKRDIETKARAQSWLDGGYWTDCAQAV